MPGGADRLAPKSWTTSTSSTRPLRPLARRRQGRHAGGLRSPPPTASPSASTAPAATPPGPTSPPTRAHRRAHHLRPARPPASPSSPTCATPDLVFRDGAERPAPNVIRPRRSSGRPCARGAGHVGRSPLRSSSASAFDHRPLGATWEMDYVRGYPRLTDNDARATGCRGRRGARPGPDAVVPDRPERGQRGTSWLLERAPAQAACPARSPAATERRDLHASTFDVDESAIASSGAGCHPHRPCRASMRTGMPDPRRRSARRLRPAARGHAQQPIEPRDAAAPARRRRPGALPAHRHVRDLPELVGPG